MAIMVLSTLAVAGGGFLFQSRSVVARQRDRLVALELTSGRLEELRASSRDAFPGIVSDTPWFLVRSGAAWAASDTPVYETLRVNQKDFRLTTQVRWQHLGGVHSNSYLDVQVETTCRADTRGGVRLATYHAP